MDVFATTFAVLSLCGGFLAYTQHKDDFDTVQPKDTDGSTLSRVEDLETAASHFKKTFLPVYLLIMGSDWLQGPYIYTLYKDEKGLSESTVAALFTTGFVAAAISATIAGGLADKFGRRLACLVFCVTYSVSCLTVLSNDIIVLFCGRLLGGLSTTLMYSVFETWMVTEYYAQNLDKSNLTLSGMFGTMTALNGFVAILAGVIGESIVAYTGTKTSPFMTSIVCLCVAFYLMYFSWGENYGDSASTTKTGPEKSAFKIIMDDKRILVLGLISTCFEGSMYLFVFFWSAALKSSHALAHLETQLPFGLIFATFMSAMMLGSLFFSFYSASLAPASHPSALETSGFLASIPAAIRHNPSLTASSLLVATIATAGASILAPVLIRNERITFWLFCLFEACIGIYFPCMGSMKGRIVDDGVRAKVYGVLRLPLNTFVVIGLSLTQEGDDHREKVFLFCGGCLLFASVMGSYFLTDETSDKAETNLELQQRYD